MDLADQILAIDIDEDDVIESEDLSHQTEAQNLKIKIEARITDKQADLAFLTRPEFTKTFKSIELGAIFELLGVFYFVSVDQGRFSIDGYEIMPLSDQSPFFKIVKGKEVNDEITFNGEEVKIQSVI